MTPQSVSQQIAKAGLNISLFALLLCFALPAFAGPPTDFVKARSNKLFEVVNQPIGPKRTSAMQAEVRALINYEEMAKRSLGKHWEARTDAEKKKFITLLESLVELNYADRFQDSQKDVQYKVDYTDEKVRKSTGQAIVKTSITHGKETFTIDYKMIPAKEKEFSIYDVVFDDISLEETYRESYVPIIDKEGWASLIKRMEDKLVELKKKG